MRNSHVLMKFNKLSSNRWYAEVDNWPGDFEDLRMIWGANTLLDKLSNGKNYVKVAIYANEVPNKFTVMLNKYKEDKDGAYYSQRYYTTIPETVFLHNIIEFVLGYFPDTIYLMKIS